MFRRPAVLLLAFLLSAASVQGWAQDALPLPDVKLSKQPAKPAKRSSTVNASGQKVERRPGELEGGFNSGVTAPLAVKKARPADVVSEKRVPDGGLPLPEVRERGFGDSPLGFDKNGSMGGQFKF